MSSNCNLTCLVIQNMYKKTLLWSALVATTLLASASVNAQYVETLDAGQTIPTASGTGIPGTSLTSIAGTLSSSTDADIFMIRITNAMTFSAIASSISGIDTSLFLFDSTGLPIVANDDASSSSFQGAIPAGNSFTMSLAPGIYYLGISLSGNEPVNLSNQLLFTLDQPTTSLRGMASGLNPKTESNFNGNTSFPESGSYNIALTSTQSAAVPEPSNIAMLIVGAAVVLFLRRFRSKAQAITLASPASLS